LISGDLDSVDKDVLEFYRRQPDVKIVHTPGFKAEIVELSGYLKFLVTLTI